MTIPIRVGIFIWILLVLQFSAQTQSLNPFSDESCIRFHEVSDCYHVILWENRLNDTIHISTVDSIFAVKESGNEGYFFVNYFSRESFQIFELITRNREQHLRSIPEIRQSVDGKKWRDIDKNFSRASINFYASGITEKIQGEASWFELTSLVEEKKLVIIITRNLPVVKKDNCSQAELLKNLSGKIQ